ncbi:hypothetical protein D8M04_10980 [Oceanobacillus piezotolerans]|uniref:Uncharacterized protein n=1 Tax=Oceanobacillus piezotolerans TaxID=2448030 RepID=A0A498D6T5_9BACI|nr:YlzJ-like family protein [Oceanobacillus piezotolerans]RLL45369.1 hypothetical protein D8M04_10980 [Oceanobacillus piezotolerans]
MILYTPLAQSDIFPPSSDDYTNRHCITHEGRLMLADRTSDGGYQMVQLLSTNPYDFLEERFTPGNILS